MPVISTRCRAIQPV
ncbi:MULTISPECIES: hypothetical protein [Streptomyces]